MPLASIGELPAAMSGAASTGASDGGAKPPLEDVVATKRRFARARHRVR